MHIVEPSQNYPNIFKPIELSNITIANRIVMGSMHTGLEEDLKIYHDWQHFINLAPKQVWA